MANTSSFDRTRIRRMAANPLVLPHLPQFPPAVKQKLVTLQSAFDRYDIDLETWRQKVQYVLEQAIMALKLDPGELEKYIAAYIAKNPDVVKAIVAQTQVVIDKMDQRGGQMTGRLLLLPGDPDAGQEAVNKDYVKRQISLLSLDSLHYWDKRLFVDIDRGNDASGQRGIFGKPYKTIAAAILDCENNDEIMLSPGTHALTSPFTLPEYISLIGAGKDATTLAFDLSGATYAIKLSRGCMVSDLYITITNEGTVKDVFSFDTVSADQERLCIRDVDIVAYANRLASFEGDENGGLTRAYLSMENINAKLHVPLGTTTTNQGLLYGTSYATDVQITNCKMTMVGADAVNAISGLDLGAAEGFNVAVVNTEIGLNNPYGDLYGIKSRGTETVYYSDVILELPMTETILFPGAVAELMREPASFTVEANMYGANPADDTFEVWNRYAASEMAYVITVNQAWLSVTPSSGSSAGEHDTITIGYDITGLTEGEYDATITISAPGAVGTPKTISVALTINPPGPLHDYGDDFEPYPIGVIVNANRLCTPLTGPGYLYDNYYRSIHDDVVGGAISDLAKASAGLLGPYLVLWNAGIKLAGIRATMPGWETIQHLAVYMVPNLGDTPQLAGHMANPTPGVQWFAAKYDYVEFFCTEPISWPTHYYVFACASDNYLFPTYLHCGEATYV